MEQATHLERVIMKHLKKPLDEVRQMIDGVEQVPDEYTDGVKDSDILATGFIWIDTKQGYDFWCQVCDEMERIENE